MSTFRKHIAITLDGEKFEMVTTAGDMLKAEEAVSREGREVQGAALMTQMRTAFYGFQRTYPDHRLVRNWQGFLAVFDDIDDLEAEQADPLDPTQPAALET